jgi:aminopeptidase
VFDIDAERFAALLCDWCLEPAPGQQVLITTTTLALPLVRQLHREILARQAWPLLRLGPPWIAEAFYAQASDEQLDSFPPLELIEAQQADASLRIDAPADVHPLAAIDPARMARAARARAPIREARLAHRWCGTLWPTPALAQQAAMDEEDFARLVSNALFLDRSSPVAAWRELSSQQAELVERLERTGEIRIETDGTDLRLSVAGRTWINSDGRRNMPSGEVFTGPHEDSASGTIRFTVPSSPPGVDVSGVELTFTAGEVVAATAERGQSYLEAALDTDSGARRLGELGIGTNAGIDRPTGSILLDEKIAGTVHLALGRSYPETGGKNSSALHWDLICDLRQGGRLTADGEALIENGRVLQ